MTTTNNTISQKNVTNVRLFVLFVLLLVANTGVFGQTKVETLSLSTPTEVSVSKENAIVVSAENTIASMDFAVWFMGTKKTTTDSKSNVSFSKKALINSGINTNSVIIKTLLKRVSSQESNIA